MGPTIHRATAALCTALLLGTGATTANAQSLSSPLDELGRPTPDTLHHIREFAAQPWLPDEVSDAILSAAAFFAGENGDGGPPLPENGPVFTQFYWPTVSGGCIDGELDAVGSAIAVPGPADIPVPGAGPGQTAFLFTALGTAPATADQGDMRVQWFNLNNFRHGVTPLENYGINPDGPATVSATADTGHGLVVAVLSGDVRTLDATCSFLPTAAVIDVR